MSRGPAVVLGFGAAVCAAALGVPAEPELTELTAPAARLVTAANDLHRPSGRAGIDPFPFVSEDELFDHLGFLTTIREHAGWRNSGSIGESEAIDFLVASLEQMPHLVATGLELERRHFHVFSATEFRETRVHVTIDGAETELPAFGISGHRDMLARALLFDSDGQLNDSEPDPVVVVGVPALVRSEADVAALPAGSVAVVDYAFIDRSLLGTAYARSRANAILARDPAGIVCVTSFSNRNGESHGTFAGDLPVWVNFDGPLPPILNLRIEDALVAGISDWDDLGRVERVQMTWDMDVYCPGHSEYLAARLPGLDSSLAVIVSAHVDSPNNPGGIDNGAGVVTVLQVAEALEASLTRPPVDLYLVWYGSHERGLYGSSNFIADHQELVDRTLAVLQVDCLSVPLDGIDMFLNLETWPYGRFGDERLTWPDYLAGLAAGRGIFANPLGTYGLVSDNTSYTAWNVPNANLIYMNPYDATEVHYAGHMHDPYDTVDLARSEAGAVVDMATLALAAALETAAADPSLRVTPAPDRRVVFVASHTESVHMTPTALVDLGMALAWHGVDVDMVPYGQPVAASDLADAAMVVVLPVHDYPSPPADTGLYDEAYTEPELDALEAYARDGGLLVLTASAHRLKYMNVVCDDNEDAADMNALAGRLGVEFGTGPLDTAVVSVTAAHPIVAGLTRLTGAAGNGVQFTHTGGQVLGSVGTAPAVLLAPAAAGEVLVLADLGLLGDASGAANNLPFWENLAEYARSR